MAAGRIVKIMVKGVIQTSFLLLSGRLLGWVKVLGVAGYKDHVV